MRVNAVLHRLKGRELSLALAGFIALSLVFTYPVVTAPGSANRLDSPDALLNAWIVSWNLHQLSSSPLELFDANIFFPEKGTLAYSENLLTASILAAPVALFTDNPILLTNIVLVAAFALTGLATFLLALDLTGDRLAAFLAGILFGFAPFRFAHIPHLQLQLAFGIPLSLFFVRRIILDPDRVYPVIGLALTAFATFGSSIYYTIFVFSVVPIVVLAEMRSLDPTGCRKALVRLGAASLLATALVGPMALPYVAKLRGGTVRSLDAASQFSAGLEEYLSSFSWLHGFLPKASEPLFPGFVAVALALYALTATETRSRRWSFVLVGGVGALLSLGPSFGLFSFLYRVFAPYRALRVPSRAGVLVLLAVAILAAIGLSRLKRGGARVLLVVVATAECLAAPLPLRFDAPTYPPIYRAVEALEAPGALVELPIPPRERFQDNALYVYRSIRHWRPLVNGYSGFAPESYRTRAEAFGRDLPGELERAHADGVRYVLAHEGRLGPRLRRQLRQSTESGILVLVAEETTDRLYEIVTSN